MYTYLDKLPGITDSRNIGVACCLANKKTREIIVTLSLNWINDFIVGHEAFHAATWYMKLNRKKFNRKRWMNIWNGWSDNEPCEETLADVCGCVYGEIWSILRSKFIVKHEEENAKNSHSRND